MRLIAKESGLYGSEKGLTVDLINISESYSIWTGEKVKVVEYILTIEENYKYDWADVGYVKEDISQQIGYVEDEVWIADTVWAAHMGEVDLVSTTHMSSSLLKLILEQISWWEGMSGRRKLWEKTNNGLKCLIPGKDSIWIDCCKKVSQVHAEDLAKNFDLPLGII